MNKPEKILIVKLGAIGDVVHAMPVLRTLRANLPSAYIAWVIEEKAAPLLRGNPDIDDLIVINTKRWRKKISLESLGEIRQFIASLRGKKIDLAIDLQGLIKSGAISWLSGAKTVIGFKSAHRREYLNGIFTNLKAGPENGKTHIIDIYLSLLNPLNLDISRKNVLFNIPGEDEHYINDFIIQNGLSGDKPLIAVNPGAGWETKKWGAKNYASLADMILEDNKCNAMITWGPGEEKLAKEIKDLMKHNVVISPPTSLTQSIALLKRCNLLVAADTGPLHIGAALGIKTAAIFGPSDPNRNGPYGEGHQILHKKLECGNCYKRICSTTLCMKQIRVEDVYNGVNKILGNGN